MEFKQWQPLASHADTLWARYTILTLGLREEQDAPPKKAGVSLRAGTSKPLLVLLVLVIGSYWFLLVLHDLPG